MAWTGESTGRRFRGPRGLADAWTAVLRRPRRFFSVGVVPGEQSAGLAFAMGVVLVEEATRLTTVDGALPVVADSVALSAVLALGVAVLLVTPAALHLVAAVQTVVLVALVEDRAGVSETVQVIAFATAPCVLAGLPVPELRVACALYGTALLVVGTAVVNDVGVPTAAAASALPAALVFGYGFRGFAAAATLLSGWPLV